ncbi:MAG TPA: hypothetical protein VJX74_08070 [Blastocatellia bacterium]|nr:hypothetical protein [Blastocatellia bacterium]
MKPMDSSNKSSDTREDLAAERLSIERHLGLNRPRAVITEEIREAIASVTRGAMFERGGLCMGCKLKPMPGHYFVAQEYDPDREDLRGALAAALEEFNLQPICADDFIWQGHVLCKVSALIQSTPFGIYELSERQNRNVYLELGIAIGLCRPFVLVKEKGADLSPLCEGLEYYPINSYLELRYEFGQKMQPLLAEIARYQPPLSPDPASRNSVIISHGGIDVADFVLTVARELKSRGLTAVITSDPTNKLTNYLKAERIPHYIIGDSGQTRLNETVAAIKAARLGVYRIEKSAAPDAFITLGVAMALNRTGILIHRSGSELPSDLKGINALEFTSHTVLQQSFPEEFGRALSR